MPEGSTLTPKEAAYIATNSYFTLQDWIHGEPKAGVESHSNIQNRVLGDANIGNASHANTSLKGTGLATGKISNVHSATTGIILTQSSGFGYTLKYEGQGEKHLVIATRGTRPEMNAMPDVFTDLRASFSNFGDYGPVHKGFKATFDSIKSNLDRDKAAIQEATVIHCVGHSLGGAIATLVAGHYAAAGKNVKLYTFGCPRVGVLNAYKSFEQRIGAQNIFRVCHDLDPVTLIAPYPYMHVQPGFNDPNHMIMPSPTGNLLSTANHDMTQYIKKVQDLNWNGVRGLKRNVEHQDDLFMAWFLHEDKDPGWVQYASAATLSTLFRLFRGALRTISTSAILGLTAIDVVAEILMKGVRLLGRLSDKILQLLEYLARWSGIIVVGRDNFTSDVIRILLEKMLSAVKMASINALGHGLRNLKPYTIGIGGVWALKGAGII